MAQIEWPQLRLRVDLAPGCSIGPGKISLLQAIAAEGSLSLAAQRIGMSYRRAWVLLDDLNTSFAQPLVKTAVGGARGGGARLTKQGDKLIRAFEALARGAQPMARRKFESFAVRKRRPRTVARRKLTRSLVESRMPAIKNAR